MVSHPTCIMYVFILSKLPTDIKEIPTWKCGRREKRLGKMESKGDLSLGHANNETREEGTFPSTCTCPPTLFSLQRRESEKGNRQNT